MTTIKRFALAATFIISLALLCPAQQQRPQRPPSVKVTADDQRVLFTAQGEVRQMRVEVFSPSGEMVYDSGEVFGQSIEWDMLGMDGRRLPNEVYQSTLTVTDPEGRGLSHHEQVIIISDESRQGTLSGASLEPTAVGTITGQGTAGKLARYTGANAVGDSLVTENAGRIGLNISPPTARLQINAPTPAPLVTNGTSAIPLLLTSGGKGGDTTGAGKAGGTGASISLVAGNGGSATAGGQRGTGGSITLQPGSYGTGSTGGSPGNVLLVPTGTGRVVIGVNKSVFAKLEVQGGSRDAVYGESSGKGVYGKSSGGPGVFGESNSGNGVTGKSTSGKAGYFVGDVNVTGTLTANGNVCASNLPCSSDSRLKQNVTALGYGLRQIMQLRPVSWHWKSEPRGGLQLGLVAQEVEGVMPELVLKDGDASKPLSLNYMALLPVAVKAIQEQQQQIGQQQALIERQSSRIEALTRTVERQQAQLDQVRRAVRRRRAAKR